MSGPSPDLKRKLYAVIGGATGLSLLLTVGAPEIGLNFVAEMAGVALTVFVVDRVVREQGEERRRPRRRAAFVAARDIYVPLSRQVTMMVLEHATKDEMRRAAVPDGMTFSETAQLLARIDLAQTAKRVSVPHPRSTWAEGLTYVANGLRESVAAYQPRHSSYADAAVAAALFELEKDWLVIRYARGEHWPLDDLDWGMFLHSAEQLRAALEEEAASGQFGHMQFLPGLLDRSIFEMAARSGWGREPDSPPLQTPSNGATGP